MIKILQWNIRSLLANFDDLKVLVGDTNPDIIVLNETFLRNNCNISISSFSLLRDDRDDGYGGLATAVRNGFDFDEVNV